MKLLFIFFLFLSHIAYGQIAEISTKNSTTNPLAADATFTGGDEEITQYAFIAVTYCTDADSGSLRLEFSPDGVNWDRIITITPESDPLENCAYGGVHTLTGIAKYFRVRWVNGGVAQTYLRIQTKYHNRQSKGLVSRSQQVLNKMNDVDLVRIVNEPNMDRARGFVGYASNVLVGGSNSAVGASFEDLWEEGGTYTWPTTARRVRIAAGNAADDSTGAGARAVIIVGLDANYAVIRDTLTTKGTSASQYSNNSYLRINASLVSSTGTYHGNNTADIQIESETDSYTLSHIEEGEGRSNQFIYTVPAGYTAYVRQGIFECSQANTATLEAFKQNGSITSAPFAPAIMTNKLVDFSGVFVLDQVNPVGLTEKTDFYIQAKKISGGGSAQVSCIFFFELIENAGD